MEDGTTRMVVVVNKVIDMVVNALISNTTPNQGNTFLVLVLQNRETTGNTRFQLITV